MIGVKTEKGRAALKDRSMQLTPRQRAAFILCDGRRTVEQVLTMTAGTGVMLEDIHHLFALGLLEDSLLMQDTQPWSESMRVTGTPRSAQERYQHAYPIAIRLTAALGLRGFKLNLAVEAASSLEQLEALAPRIAETVGEPAFAPLRRALRE